jgi:hypothetical protein
MQLDSDNLGIEPFLPQIDADRLLPLAEAGLMSEQEIQQVRATREALVAGDRPFILMIILMACRLKP